ncbi:MAG: hypothetical protein R2911_36250 [Caldilineaceae bacterium]
MHNRRTFTILSLLVVLALALAACAPMPAGDTGAAGGAAAEAGPTTITWAMWGSPEEVPRTRK